MQRLFEFLFGWMLGPPTPGMERGIEFNPPAWMFGQAKVINTLLVIMVAAAVFFIYRREGRRTWPRIALGAMRIVLFLWVIALLNRPVVRETRTNQEVSVVAILIDNSISMSIPDVDLDGRPTTGPVATGGVGTTRPVDDITSPSRINAVINVLSAGDQALIRRLQKVHTLRLYTFNKDASPITAAAGNTNPDLVADVRNQRYDPDKGRTTQVLPSLLTVLNDLQGQRLAGVVVFTDARETPTASPPALLDRLKRYTEAKIYPVVVGSDKAPTNIDLISANMQESVFKDDIVTAKVQVRATGYDPNHPLKVLLRDKRTKETLKAPDGRPAEKIVIAPDANPLDEEILFKPAREGLLDVEVVAEIQPGELNEEDNVRVASVAVLDATINVLYVDGYPRWEYRYIKNEMIRDKTVNISCLLTSADQTFFQEGDPADERVGFPGPITRFPETIEELMKYDVVLFGDVDSRQFTDAQLQMISDFVSKKGGGFGMVAGPRYSPIAYRNTPVEAVLPVNIAQVLPEDIGAEYKDGWRPIVTDEGRRGEASTIFRFFADTKVNDKYLKEDLQPLFWFSQGVTAKQGTGLVYAEHPIITGPDGRKAPILVLGRFGAGRTIFGGIDDSWRWRYYTGESVFDTYWVQQIRYLARSKKLGQRRMTFGTDKTAFELGERVTLTLNVLDSVLVQQLPPQIKVDIVDEKGQVVGQVALVRQENPPGAYTASFTAGTVGRFTAKLPQLVSDQPPPESSFHVMVPKLELSKPEVDRVMLTKLAPAEQIVQLADARTKLPELIKSAARTVPVSNTTPLFRPNDGSAWWALGIFVLLLTGEWVLRKVFGML